MAQKFNNQHYCTKEISERLPITTQVILWRLIQTMEVEEQDYLQVFTLSIEDGQQKILHEQEFPEYSAGHLFPSTNPITGKVFVIDDETHSTMLFAENTKEVIPCKTTSFSATAAYANSQAILLTILRTNIFARNVLTKQPPSVLTAENVSGAMITQAL